MDVLPYNVFVNRNSKFEFIFVPLFAKNTLACLKVKYILNTLSLIVLLTFILIISIRFNIVIDGSFLSVITNITKQWRNWSRVWRVRFCVIFCPKALKQISKSVGDVLVNLLKPVPYKIRV